MPVMENTIHTTSHKFRRIGLRVRKLARDISYLERRKLELHTGLAMFGPDQR
jgi:hypothetical protein